jgi:hypothetical protein
MNANASPRGMASKKLTTPMIIVIGKPLTTNGNDSTIIFGEKNRCKMGFDSHHAIIVVKSSLTVIRVLRNDQDVQSAPTNIGSMRSE